MLPEWEKAMDRDDWWSETGTIPASSTVVSRSQVSAPLIPKYEKFASTKGTAPNS